VKVCTRCHRSLPLTEFHKHLREPELTQDHVRPLTRGGLHLMSNLLPACLPCNQSKGGRLLAEWSRYGRVTAEYRVDL
jgi:5-methylcytosine-specific restriction endonuclease McrA